MSQASCRKTDLIEVLLGTDSLTELANLKYSHIN